MTRPPPSLDLMFEALSDATRRSIVEQLSKGTLADQELVQQTDMPLSIVLRSLQILEASGLVRTRKIGSIRMCTLQPAGFQAIESWVNARSREGSADEKPATTPPPGRSD